MAVVMWLPTALAIIGTVLVIRKQRAGFACWVVADLAFAARNIQIYEYAQVALWAVYTGLAAWGFWSWRKP